MNEEKLQKLAIKISDLIKDSSSIQRVYEQMTKVFNKQKIFFDHFSRENLIKIIFYVYSYKTTKDFALATSILNNLFFAGLYNNTGDEYVENCGDCDGYGEVSCDYCSGDGQIECGDCSGTGQMDCEECDGEGTIDDDGDEVECHDCSGRGTIECDTCGGDGYERCQECVGSGNKECEECSGKGSIDTDESQVTFYSICSWDKELKDKCELWEDTRTPVMSHEEFSNSDKILILKIDTEGHYGFGDEAPDEEMVYCSSVDDEPRLFINTKMEIYPSYYYNDIEW